MPGHITRVKRAVEVWLHPFLTSDSHHERFSQEKILSARLRWVGTGDGLDAVKKKSCFASARNRTMVPRSSNP